MENKGNNVTSNDDRIYSHAYGQFSHAYGQVSNATADIDMTHYIAAIIEDKPKSKMPRRSLNTCLRWLLNIKSIVCIR